MRKVVLIKMRFRCEYGERVVVVVCLEVVGEEGVADLAEKAVMNGGRGRTLLEFVNYLLPQLQLDVVDQVFVFAKGIQQLFLVEVLFVHRYL